VSEAYLNLKEKDHAAAFYSKDKITRIKQKSIECVLSKQLRYVPVSVFEKKRVTSKMKKIQS